MTSMQRVSESTQYNQFSLMHSRKVLKYGKLMNVGSEAAMRNAVEYNGHGRVQIDAIAIVA